MIPVVHPVEATDKELFVGTSTLLNLLTLVACGGTETGVDGAWLVEDKPEHVGHIVLVEVAFPKWYFVDYYRPYNSCFAKHAS